MPDRPPESLHLTPLEARLAPAAFTVEFGFALAGVAADAGIVRCDDAPIIQIKSSRYAELTSFGRVADYHGVVLREFHAGAKVASGDIASDAQPDAVAVGEESFVSDHDAFAMPEFSGGVYVG